VSSALEAATEHQARARVALQAALAAGPSHAYLFRGPRGSGKRAAARALAAEILAGAAADPEDARRRALLDPSPHPDLVWIAPRGAQHMVEDLRERVIRAAAYRPFEGGKRVFVIEAAEALRDESQNALLKTLEEPPAYAHLILLSAEPEALLETIASRCAPVEFAPYPAEVLEAELAASAAEVGDAAPEEIAAAARLAAGDRERARLLLSPLGRELRAEADACVAAARGGELAAAPWRSLLDRATAAGEEAEASAREALEEEAKAGIKRSAREIADEAKRVGRRRRTEILDLGLELCAAHLRDLAAIAAGAEEVAFARDRLEALRVESIGLEPGAARRAAAAAQETRRSLDLNVSEELALEALFFRLAGELRQRPARAR
jgi:DNA polymerase-3 subunit delta'